MSYCILIIGKPLQLWNLSFFPTPNFCDKVLIFFAKCSITRRGGLHSLERLSHARLIVIMLVSS